MIHLIMEYLSDEDIRIAFGKRLKQLRKNMRLTQKEAGAHIGVHATHLNKYEAGMHTPSLQKIIALANLYGVTLDYLILGKDPGNHELRNLRLFERFQALESFEHDDMETVVKVIDAMIAKTKVTEALHSMPT